MHFKSDRFMQDVENHHIALYRIPEHIQTAIQYRMGRLLPRVYNTEREF